MIRKNRIGWFGLVVAGLLSVQGRAATVADVAETAPDPKLIVVGAAAVPSRLVAIDSDNPSGGLATTRILFQTDDVTRPVVVPELVRWGHPHPAGTRSRAVLSDGSVLIAADSWTVAEPIRLGDTSLCLAMRSGISVDIPREMVRGVLFHPPGDPRERYQMVASMSDQKEQEDAILMTHGDRLRGSVRSVTADGLHLVTAAGDVQYKTSGIAAVLLNPVFLRIPPRLGLRMLVGLRDGSLVVARHIQPVVGGGQDPGLEIETLGGLRFQLESIAEIVYFQSLGGQARYLSDTTPESYRHIPYLDIPWSYGKDQNVLGGRLRIQDGIYTKGIGVHSTSRLVYKLDGTPRRFAAEIGIDSMAGQGGSVVFRIFLARGDAWHEVFTSPIVRGGDGPQPVVVEIDQARGLALVVDHADHGDELDYANWFDARLED